jgi:hypothetical protein
MNPRYHPDPLRPPLQARAETSMTPAQYRRAIERLGLSQVRAARFFGLGDRTGASMAHGNAAIPRAVELLIKQMLKNNLTPGDLDSAFKQED